MKLSELVRIDNRFEKAVNLRLDFDNDKKISNYIPTHSAMNVLRDFLSNIQSEDSERASLFIGPYGKGKSHLLLVLLNLISKEDTDAIKVLLRKIRKVEPDVYALITNIRRQFFPFLPVVITPGNGTLAQTFIRSLSAALIRFDMENVVPDDYYSAAVQMIERWETQYPITFQNFKDLLQDTDVEAFVSAIKHYDPEAMMKFRELYPQLTSGSTFNPVVEEDAVAVYRSINRKIRDLHGYKGIYVIFDEFSKFIEGSDPDRFSADMATLQGICELAGASHEEQLHITCVVHRSIKTYRNLPDSVMNAFRGVEGRLSEKTFIVSSQNNYELIADAIEKTAAYKTWKKDCGDREKLVHDSYGLKAFRSLFDEGDYERIVGDGCFPLTPVAAMLLLNVSELIAQNERTIFTYIAGKEIGGLYNTVRRSEGDDSIGIANIYDYFSPLMRDAFLPSIHHEWVKAEYALTRTEDDKEKAIIKALAVVKMINKKNELPAVDKILRLAAGFAEPEYVTARDSLIDAGIIRLRERTKEYEFKNNIGIDIETVINDCIQKNFTRIDVGNVIQKAVREKNTVPKKHNQTNSITRYFNHCFMTEKQFLALTDPSFIEWKTYPDGIIIHILGNDLDLDHLLKHTEELACNTLVVRVPSESKFDYVYAAKRYQAVRKIISDGNLEDDRQMIRHELDDILEDVAGSINDFYQEVYVSSNTAIMYDGMHEVGDRGFNRFISDVCDSAYNKTPRINHEMINRHAVSGQISRARSTIMKGMLSGADLTVYENGTSAESTIFRAVMRHTKDDENLASAKALIRGFIHGSIGEKASFRNIVSKLVSAPYGMRRGVIPFYVLEQILLLEDMPVISLHDKEVTISETAIINAVNNPTEYYLYVEKETVQKSEYIGEMEKLFDDFKIYCADIDRKNKLAHLTCLMQAWYRSLPQSSLVFREKDYDGQKMELLTAFRSELGAAYINPREFLFDQIPSLFEGTELKDIPTEIRQIRLDLDAHIHHLKKHAANTIRRNLDFSDETDLQQSLRDWYEGLSDQVKNSVLSFETQGFLNYIQALSTGDEEEIAGKIVNIITGGYIEDWKDGMIDTFDEQLSAVVHEIDDAMQDTVSSKSTVIERADGNRDVLFYDFDKNDISSTGTFFSNSLEDLIEEYDGILDNKEKIGILVEAIKRLSGAKE